MKFMYFDKNRKNMDKKQMSVRENQRSNHIEINVGTRNRTKTNKQTKQTNQKTKKMSNFDHINKNSG